MVELEENQQPKAFFSRPDSGKSKKCEGIENDVIGSDGEQGGGKPAAHHPLQSSWSLWFKRDNPNNNWGNSQKLVHTFDTVEDFWSLFNYIQPANLLSKGCDYSLFKKGIEPTWEDAINSDGGRWILQIQKKSWDEKTHIDKYWLETVLCMIGEGFDDMYSEHVAGAVVSIRAKANRVAIWSTTTDQTIAQSIGDTFKRRLKLAQSVLINFQSHRDAQQQKSSASKHLYTI